MSGFNEKDLGQAIQALFTNLLSREVHTCLPGKVVKVYSGTASRMVDVQPLIKRVDSDGVQKNIDILQGVLLMSLGSICKQYTV